MKKLRYLFLVAGLYLALTRIVQAATPIGTLEELQAVKNDLAGSYYLANDIEAAASAGWNGGLGFEPIGTIASPFTGTLDGKGYEVRNLKINRPNQDAVGLFGAIENGGTVLNTGLKSVNITGRNQVGVLSGYLFLSSVLNNYVQGGTVTGSYRVGGLIGESYNGSGIFKCNTNVTVVGGNETGGLVGKSWDGSINTISESFALGPVTGQDYVGGFVGYSKSSDFLKCYAQGNVTGANYVGGLAGYTIENAGIHDCYYSTGTISGQNYVGGIVGYFNSYHDGVSRTYFAGTVSGTSKVGGFLGAFINTLAGQTSSNFWDITLNPGLQDTGNVGDKIEITAATTTVLQQQATFTDWDFNTVWKMFGYPQLRIGIPIRTVEELQAIKNDLAGIYYLANDIDAFQSAGWNGGLGFEPIGSIGTPFVGTLDGKGYEINNLTINRPNQDAVGLFGAIANGGTVVNTGLTNANIIGRNQVGALSGYLFVSSVLNNFARGGTVAGSYRVGGLIGESYNGSGIFKCNTNVTVLGGNETGGLVGKSWDGSINTISESFALGPVTGQDYVGGFVGYSKSSDFLKCYAQGNVTGTNYVGGLAGYTIENAGIHDCYYSTGTVSGQNFVGGIVGYFNSYHDGVSRTYFAGTVSGTSNVGGFLGAFINTLAGQTSSNFWDNTLNPGLQDTGNVGDKTEITAASTAVMQLQATFTDWDFNAVWKMADYPRFQSEVIVTGSVIIENGADYWVEGAATAFLSASQGITEMRNVSTGQAGFPDLPSSWAPYQSSVSFPTYPAVSGGQDGTKQFIVQFRDELGNTSPIYSDSIIEDSIPPVGQIIINNGDAYTQNPVFTLTLSATDSTSGITKMQFSQNGGISWDETVGYSQQILYSAASENGQRDVTVRFLDAAGNISAQVTDSIILDNRIPTGSIVISGGANFINTPNVTVALSASDPESGVTEMQFSKDGGLSWENWISYATSYALALPSPDGSKEIRVRFRDAAQNVSVDASDSITLDITAPTGSIVITRALPNLLPYTLSQGITLNLNASDATSGVDQMSFREGNGVWSAWEPYAVTKLFTLTQGDGRKDVYVSFKDHAGNTSISNDFIFLGVGSYLSEQNLAYFNQNLNPGGSVDPVSAYPYEGFTQDMHGYTQPTAIGQYALLLGNVIAGNIKTDHIADADARAKLTLLVNSLLSDQANPAIAYKGLFPWVKFTASGRARGDGLYGNQVAFVDNANMTVSLAAASGALNTLFNQGDGVVVDIVNKIETFIANQQQGYSFLRDTTKEIFKGGYNFTTGFFGENSHYGNEFQDEILFIVLKYGYSANYYKNLFIEIEDYFKTGQPTKYSVAPQEGAFQILWPLMTMPQTNNASLKRMLENFIDVALDFAQGNSQPGFLSACYKTPNAYEGAAGIQQIAINAGALNEKVPSVYTLGAAHAVRTVQMETFMNNMIQTHPELDSGHGLWEGLNMEASPYVIQQQVAANVTSFVLGMAGTGTSMLNYLQRFNLTTTYNTLLQVGGTYDVIANSASAFSWPDTIVTGTRNGASYTLRTVNGAVHTWSGTAFTNVLGGQANISGRRLVIRYSSTTDVGDAQIEFKQNLNGTLILRQLVRHVVFKNTGGATETINIDFPATPALNNINEFIIYFPPPPPQRASGTTLNMTFSDFDIVSIDTNGGGGGGGGSSYTPTSAEDLAAKEALLLELQSSLKDLASAGGGITRSRGPQASDTATASASLKRAIQKLEQEIKGATK